MDLTRHRIFLCLKLGLPTIWNVRNKCVWFISHSVYDIFVKAAQMNENKTIGYLYDQVLTLVLSFLCPFIVRDEVSLYSIKVTLSFSYLSFNCLLIAFRLPLSFSRMSLKLTINHWNLLSLQLLLAPSHPLSPQFSKAWYIAPVHTLLSVYLWTILVLLQICSF